ncbi:Beta-galactosidase C-terminal domain [Dactylosporangium sp. NPDC050688]|uniref:Beta-galactosidase C-terminal domain n=1 Tax=Dactylosporangium sp. NPDC050688 TaxID=3157217 RepID=UPI0033EB9EC5
MRRAGPDGTGYLFLLNHSAAEVGLRLAGTDLLTGARHDAVRIPAGGVVVLAVPGESPPAAGGADVDAEGQVP